MTTKKLWLGFIAVMTVSFAVLLFFGRSARPGSSSDLNLAGALRNSNL